MKNNEIVKALEGAWEERGVVGTRIEIKKNVLTVLWRGGVVLETKFKTEQSGDAVILALGSNGLRYRGSSTDYATVIGIRYEGGALIYEESFTITGKSVTKLEKTLNSRYGNVVFAPRSILRELRGTWRDDSGYRTLVFSGDMISINGDKIKIRVVYGESGPCRIINADPSKDGVGYFYEIDYLIDTIKAHVIACDAPSAIYTFRRVKKEGSK